MKRDTSRQRYSGKPSRLAFILCTALVACDGSVRLCGEYACVFYQHDYQNDGHNHSTNHHQTSNGNAPLNDPQVDCNNTLFVLNNCEPALRQCEATATIRDRAPDILNQLREANRACAAQTSASALSIPAPTLIWDETLAQLSTDHALDMATHGFESSTGSNGLTTNDRARLAGITATIISENVEAGPQTTVDVINSWLDRQTDCEKMLDPQTTRIGMACALPESATGGPYWSLLLASPDT